MSDTNAGYVDQLRVIFDESIRLKQHVLESRDAEIIRIASAVAASLSTGNKVLLCGNGGSAADAQHLAAELLVRLRPGIDRRGLPAIALVMDPSSVTACSNDYSFEVHFERMARALGESGDVLVGITTSGRSQNVVRALRAGREIGMTTVGLLGGDGGDALAACDFAVVVPSTDPGRVQESHITIGHAVMQLVEEMLIAEGQLEVGGR
jgi:D-sedoheptulose 7-phosphate isomerase